MQLCHLLRLGDGGEVHDLVLFDHSGAKGAQLLRGLLAEVKTQRGKAGCEGLQHHGASLGRAPTMPSRST